MEAVLVVDDTLARPPIVKMWWLFLITGVGWMFIAMVVLAFDPTSAAAIGYLMGIALMVSGINEIFSAAMVDSWRWLHAAVGLLFVITGVAAMVSPFQTFGILALLIGWYLIFKGTLDLVVSIAGRHEIDLWGFLLAAGLLQLAIGVWALGYPGRSAYLLILWVGIGALMRGITEIIQAFHLRHIGRSA